MGSRRSLLAVVVAALAGCTLLVATGAAWAKTGPEGAKSAKLQGRHGNWGGVIPPVPLANAPRQTDTPQGGGDLQYHNGPVMRTNTTYAIYWLPSGYTFNGNNSGYENTINQYLTDVAADSGKTTNVYATDPQYYDTVGGGQHPAAYQSSFAGSVVITTALPSSGCPGAIPGYTVCLTDAQLHTVINDTITAQGWPRDLAHMYFLMTPPGVGSCFGSTAGSGCSYDDYCAYHGVFHPSGGVNVVYANQPYTYNVPWPQNTAYLACEATADYPNGASTGADPTINVISHEHNEAITDPTVSDDPLPTGWWDNQGYENGDKCAWGYGTLSGTSGSRYNQTINGHHYLLQEEYDNASHDCVQALPPTSTPPTITSISPLAGIAGTTVTINGTNFGSSPTVHFTGSAVDSPSVTNTATQITVTVPNDAVNGAITVSTTDGDASSTTFRPTMKITGVDQLNYQAGDQVVVSGSNFLANGPLSGKVGTVPISINPLSTTATSFEFDLPANAVSATLSATNLNSTVSGALNGVKVRPRIDTMSVDHAPAGGHVTFTGATFTGTTSVKFNNVVPGTFTIGSGGTSLNVTVPTAAVNGPIAITNAGGTTMSDPFSVDPHVTGLSPLAAPGGTNVTILGSGFGTSPTVTFTGSGGPAAIVSSTPTKIVATVPTDATNGPIDVSTGGVTDALTATFKPQIKIVSVDHANYQVGDQVTVTGTNFVANGPLTVKVGTVGQTLDTLVPAGPPTPTQLSFHLANTTATGALSITNGNGTVISAPGLVKVRPTVLDGPSPDHDVTGHHILFHGYTFQGTTSVKFNGVTPGLFTVSTPDLSGVRTLNVTVPAGATDGPIVITNAGGPTTAGSFDVMPHVTSITPASGPANANVTINGTGFGTAPTVTFNNSGAPATLVSAIPTKIVAKVPADAQNGPIHVVNANTYDAFTATFKPSMRVASFDQPFYYAGGTVIVTGTNLLATGTDPTAKLGLIPLVPASVTDTSLQLTLPASAPYAVTGPLTLTNANGSTSSTPNSIKIRAHVDTFPNAATTGTHIVIQGNTFNGTTSVKFGNNTVPGAFTIGLGGLSLNVTVPAGATSGPIGITNAGGTELTDPFHVLPHITSFTPAHGAVGATVTITGTGLLGADQVFFNPGPSQTVGVPISATNTTVKVLVPVGTGSGRIQVRTPEGLSNLSTAVFGVP